MTPEQRESIFERQLIDCNCNDCAFLVRNLEKFEESKKRRDGWQRTTFESRKKRVLEEAKSLRERGSDEKADNLFKIANNMKYHFLNNSRINFGRCEKLDKDITFMPNQCQLETQECFEHRKKLKQTFE